MARASPGQPRGARLVIDEVPDAAPGRHLELPLFEALAAVRAVGEVVSEPVLSIRCRRRARPITYRFECQPRVAGRLPTQFLPALRRVVGGEAHLVLALAWRRRDPIAALG